MKAALEFGPNGLVNWLAKCVWKGKYNGTSRNITKYKERKIRRNMLTASPMQGQVRCCRTVKERAESHEWAQMFMLPV